MIVKLVKQKRSNNTSQRELNTEGKGKFKSQKVYVSELLSPKYKKLLRKCNALLKKYKIDGFNMISSNVKMKIDDETTKVMSHNEDLIEIFGKEMLETTK